jgi:hypothetical protein
LIQQQRRDQGDPVQACGSHDDLGGRVSAVDEVLGGCQSYIGQLLMDGGGHRRVRDGRGGGIQIGDQVRVFPRLVPGLVCRSWPGGVGVAVELLFPDPA